MSQTSENTKQTVLLNTIFLYLRMIVTIVVGLYASRVVLQVLGESDYGVYSLVGGIVVVLSFLNAGMLQASQRFLSFALGKGDTEELNKTFWASWYAHLILAIVIVIIGEAIGIYIVNYVLSIPADRIYAANWVYQCSILTCAASVLSVPYNSVIIAHEKMNLFAYISILEACLKLVIIYLLLVVAVDKLILYAVLMFVVQTLIRFIYSIYGDRHFSECSSQRCFDKEILKRIFRFTGWSLLGNLGITSKDQGVSIVLNIFFQTPVINAARGIAIQVNGIISTFATNISMAINPPITKTYANGNINESKSLVYIGCRASFYMLTVLIVPFVVNSDYILGLWLGNVPANTSLFLYFIFGCSLIYAMSQPITTAIQATGKIKKFQIWIFALMMGELILTSIVLWLTKSLIYALIPSVAFNFLAALMRLEILSEMENAYKLYDYSIKVILRCIIVLIVSLAFAFYLHQLVSYNNILFFLIECVLIGITTIVVVVVLGMTHKEKCSVFRYIQRLL